MHASIISTRRTTIGYADRQGSGGRVDTNSARRRLRAALSGRESGTEPGERLAPLLPPSRVRVR